MAKQVNIESKDVKVPEDSDGKPDFTEGKQYSTLLEKASGAKYDSLDDMYQARKKVSFWTKLKLTVQGKTEVGRIVGTGLDIAELFAPGWAVKTRHVIQSKTKPKTMTNKVETWTEKAKRYLKQDSTKAALAVAASVIGAIFSGVHIDADVLTQSVTGFLTAGALIYTGWLHIKGFFKDEDA